MNQLRLSELLPADAFDDVIRGFLRPPRWDVAGAAAPQIKVDVTEDAAGYVVKAEIPGVRKEDIDVRIDGPQVSIGAEVKKQTEEKEDGRVLRSERYYGYMSRAFSLASDVDQAGAVAKYQDGVLELRLPKKPNTESRKLAVQ